MAPNVGDTSSAKEPGMFTPGNTIIHRAVKKKLDGLFFGTSSSKPTTDSYEKSRTSASFLKRSGFEDDTESKTERYKQLESKSRRVHSKWNKFKNFFGCGEKMTQQEETEYSNLYRQQLFQKKWDKEHEGEGYDIE